MTLVETMTVVFVLTSIVSLAIPGFQKTVAKANLTGCQSNLRNLANSVSMYSSKTQDARYPKDLSELMPEYIKSIPTCPAAKMDTYSEGYEVDAEANNYTIQCRGHHHASLKFQQDQPYYSGNSGLGPIKP